MRSYDGGAATIVPRRDRSHSLLRADLFLHCTPQACIAYAARGFSMMDGLVRGSYDINYAKSGS